MTTAPRKRVLWMDSEIDFLKAHILFLEDHGFDVEKAVNTMEGMALLHREKYDLVLLDEQIAGKEGPTSTLNQIKSVAARIPVVVVTKSEEGRLAEAAWGQSFEGSLGKPVNPVQALTVCKEALRAGAMPANHVTASYVRDISEIKSGLLAIPSPFNWAKVYFKLCKWDVELQMLSNPNLVETHRGHKKDLSRKFIHYVENNYVDWIGKRGGNPDMHTQTVRRKVVPLLQSKKKAALIVMSGMRVGQWLYVQKLLDPLFKVENNVAWALLPTENAFCRTALFSGLLPRDVALNQPQLWERLLNDEDALRCQRELLKIHLRTQRVDLDDPVFIHVNTKQEAERLSSELAQHEDSRLIVIVVELLDMLDLHHRDHPLAPMPTEKDLREKTSEWFTSSGMLKALEVLAESKRSVVLTSDHGTVRADSPAEVFCQEDKSPNPRVKIGPNISCDERQALFVEAPSRFGLPGEAGELAYAIAKENFYFVYPNKFQYFVTQFKDQMVSGGLSMEEIVVPLATLTPK